MFLLDLISLAKDPDASAVLATTLSRMFSSPDIIKMGLAFKNDLKLLAASYPDLGCFRECKPYLDGSSLLESRDGKVARGKKYGQFPHCSRCGELLVVGYPSRPHRGGDLSSWPLYLWWHCRIEHRHKGALDA